MANVTGTILNLFNGVSQQTSSLRLPTQGEEQINMYPSLVQGLVKRPPLEVISAIEKAVPLGRNGTFHVVDRGGDNVGRERTLIHISPDGITAFRPDGTRKPVDIADGALEYLRKGASGKTGRYVVTTIADHTFISNLSVDTGAMDDRTPSRGQLAMVKVKQAAYECDYIINLEMRSTTGEPHDHSVVANVKTWESVGTEDDPPKALTITDIVEGLDNKLNGKHSGFMNEPGYKGPDGKDISKKRKEKYQTLGLFFNTLFKDRSGKHELGGNDPADLDTEHGMYKKKPDATPPPGGAGGGQEPPQQQEDYTAADCYRTFTHNDTIYIVPKPGFRIAGVHVKDGNGNNMMVAVTDTAERFSDLPAWAPLGTVIRITGTDTTTKNDYYVKYVKRPDAADESAIVTVNNPGIWQECPAPGVKYKLNPATLPHVLIDYGSRFTFGPSDKWGERTCGDDDTCPFPEFLGQPITGVFQYRNRLGFLSMDVVALSEASNFFNFFRTSAMTTTDSDPIFLSGSIEGAPTLRYAVPFNEEIVLFSDRAQFKIVATEVLSPATAAINTLTTYPMNPEIRPVSNGKNIFFCNTQKETYLNKSTRVYEYFIDSDTGTKSAMEITSHVPQYISSEVTDMACSPGLSLMCLFARGSNELWFYKYYWSGNEKLQAAWFKMTLGYGQYRRSILGAGFIDDILYLLVRTGNHRFLCKMDFSVTLKESVGADTLTKPYLDMYVDDYKPDQIIYDGYDNESRINLPPYMDPERTVVFDKSVSREVFYSAYDPEARQLVIPGRFAGTNLSLGERYDASYTFSHAFVRGGDGSNGSSPIAAHLGRLQLQRWRLILGPTGYVKATVVHENGAEYSYVHSSIYPNFPRHELGRANANEFVKFQFPVRGDAALTTIRLDNPTWFPSSVVSAEWDANYITKGRRHV